MNDINFLLFDLYSKLRNGIKPGLERTIALANSINNPQSNLNLIHIAGTNGKGSVCSMLASILQESGYNVGLYTSPHIIKFNERIQVNGKQISDNEVIDIYNLLKEKANEIEATFFEITTLMAFEYFRRQRVDIAIIETGMGGRFDSTNIIKPIASVLTSISMDHQDYLGDTIAKIASEKGGIIKSHIPVIVQNNIDEVLLLLSAIANKLESPIYFSKDYPIENIKYKPNLQMSFDTKWHNDTISILSPFSGKHQIDNHKTVFNTLQLIATQFQNISAMSIAQGIKNSKVNANLRGRLELLENQPKIILDGSHNPDAISYCLETIKSSDLQPENFNIYFTCMKDKDYSLMLRIIRKYTDKINFVNIKEQRGIDTKILLEVAQELNFNKISLYNLYELVELYKQKRSNMLILGSFYLVSEFLESL
ncbi:MAG TPA: folylpolyglutamate synthase/dihydrofolate synthase family protein [Candidatus Kapabacteria bacterium]|nr:folylpolyglutamate synthase/dihydrofolate synthase family protein [Candidatus Kapabacteria bacterium]